MIVICLEGCHGLTNFVGPFFYLASVSLQPFQTSLLFTLLFPFFSFPFPKDIFFFFLTPFPGSGKTQLCKEFEAAGYNVFDEAFMDMPSVNLHPQSFVMENIWVSHWIQRLLIKQKVGFSKFGFSSLN